jgi:hypothetical protein
LLIKIICGSASRGYGRLQHCSLLVHALFYALTNPVRAAVKNFHRLFHITLRMHHPSLLSTFVAETLGFAAPDLPRQG